MARAWWRRAYSVSHNGRVVFRSCYAVQDRGSGLDAVHVLHSCCCVAVSVLLCLVALGLSQMRFTAAQCCSVWCVQLPQCACLQLAGRKVQQLRLMFACQWASWQRC